MSSACAVAWEMSNEANLFLLESIAEEAMGARYSARTRTVAAQFAHMHNVRLRWLEHSARELAADIDGFARGAEPSRDELVAALKASAGPIARFLAESEAAGKVKNWNGPPASFLGYLVAHEAHHRGLAMVALRAAEHKPPKEVVYGQWDWGKRRSLR